MLTLTPIRGDCEAEDNTDIFSNENIISLNHILVNKAKKEIRIQAGRVVESEIPAYFSAGNQGKIHENVFKIGGNQPYRIKGNAIGVI